MLFSVEDLQPSLMKIVNRDVVEVQRRSIVTPDGLVSSLMGPAEGKLGDWILWRLSGVETKIRNVLRGLPEDHDGLYVYGDPAYAGGFGVMGPFKRRHGQQLTEAQEQFNAEMSRVRISVEQISDWHSSDGLLMGLSTH